MDIAGFLRDLWARVVALGNEVLLLIAQVQNVNTQINVVAGNVDNQGQTLIGLNTVVTTIQAQTGSPTYGNAALLTAIGSVEAALEAYIDTAVNVVQGESVVTLTQILAAIGGIPAPPTPPDVPAIVAGVWAEVDPFSRDHATPYGQEQADAAEWAKLMKDGGSAPAFWSPFFNISYPPLIPD